MKLVLPTTGRGDDGSGFGGGGDVCTLPLEWCSTLYHDLSDTVYMSSGREMAGSMGDPTVVGSGQP